MAALSPDADVCTDLRRKKYTQCGETGFETVVVSGEIDHVALASPHLRNDGSLKTNCEMELEVILFELVVNPLVNIIFYASVAHACAVDQSKS